MKPIVAIIGRPNVGKSTLFNAIAKKNIAIVDDLPGVTRDRNYTDVSWENNTFTLVDTGGFDPLLEDDLLALVQEQAQMAVEEADIIIFLMDAKDGLIHGDIAIARILQQTDKPVIFVLNKVESHTTEDAVAEFYRLGTDDIVTVSAKNRLGISDIMYRLGEQLPRYQQMEQEKNEIVVSIIGRPNVGKSSFINRLIGRERLLVSDQAGTTRDAVDSVLTYNGTILRFIDTAGIRKKSRISFQLEKYCVLQALKSITRSTVSILMLDAQQGITTQDAKLAAQVYERNRACILVVNKWDLIEKSTKTFEAFKKMVYDELPFMDFAPIVVISALTGLRVRKILDVILEIGTLYHKRISTSQFNRELKTLYEKNPPPRGTRGRPKIFYGSQVVSGPPIFKLFTSNPKEIPQNYKKFLERSIRERFGFIGNPVCLQFVHRTRNKG